jgi:hypothetical protein
MLWVPGAGPVHPGRRLLISLEDEQRSHNETLAEGNLTGPRFAGPRLRGIRDKVAAKRPGEDSSSCCAAGADYTY